MTTAISKAMADFLRPLTYGAHQKKWPAMGTTENALAQQAQAKGLMSAKPVNRSECRFEATEAGKDAVRDYDLQKQGR
jgi:hypothetical protein